MSDPEPLVLIENCTPENPWAVQRAWVQSHDDLKAVLGAGIKNHPDKWRHLGYPIRIADEKHWAKLLLLEGTPRCRRLRDLWADQPLPQALNDINMAVNSLTRKYIA